MCANLLCVASKLARKSLKVPLVHRILKIRIISISTFQNRKKICTTRFVINSIDTTVIFEIALHTTYDYIIEIIMRINSVEI